ncbi:uncharacterized protein [Watersipora subatra]|uniref:uncharacterized protein n=1 Tax=Watersipora subatra TaxID=2589382 RepID=UPI00355C6F28
MGNHPAHSCDHKDINQRILELQENLKRQNEQLAAAKAELEVMKASKETKALKKQSKKTEQAFKHLHDLLLEKTKHPETAKEATEGLQTLEIERREMVHSVETVCECLCHGAGADGHTTLLTEFFSKHTLEEVARCSHNCHSS